MYQVKIKVKELCEARNWTINELSRRSGVTYSTVRRYATRSLPKIDMDAVYRIKNTFGCTWDELLELEGDDSFDS
jgi:transcriptional regulator with XRE-family HTH domain